jgi:hypothetical protein
VNYLTLISTSPPEQSRLRNRCPARHGLNKNPIDTPPKDTPNKENEGWVMDKQKVGISGKDHHTPMEYSVITITTTKKPCNPK